MSVITNAGPTRRSPTLRVPLMIVLSCNPSTWMMNSNCSGQRARVHWRFLPDSYAEWLPLRSAPNASASERTQPPGSGPWRVSLRWALDSEKFNE
jgi:hypothetical protein